MHAGQRSLLLRGPVSSLQHCCLRSMYLCQRVPWASPTTPASTQFMLGGTLEAVEITATRFFVFQPVQGACCLLYLAR